MSAERVKHEVGSGAPSGKRPFHTRIHARHQHRARQRKTCLLSGIFIWTTGKRRCQRLSGAILAPPGLRGFPRSLAINSARPGQDRRDHDKGDQDKGDQDKGDQDQGDQDNGDPR